MAMAHSDQSTVSVGIVTVTARGRAPPLAQIKIPHESPLPPPPSFIPFLFYSNFFSTKKKNQNDNYIMRRN